MAKKQNKESQAEQSERFRKAVQDMIDAGELNPTKAEEAFERVMTRISPPQTNGGEDSQTS